MNPCQVAADTAGNVYASNWSNGPTKRFQAADFSAGARPKKASPWRRTSSGMYADPETDDIYIDERSKISRYDSSGSLIQTIGSSESLGTNSRGVAVNANTGHVYATNHRPWSSSASEEVPYEPIDNPAVIHGVHDSGSHNYEDFQVSPDGRYALFNSVRLTDRVHEPGALRDLPLRLASGFA